jgi:hypothetical protein
MKLYVKDNKIIIRVLFKSVTRLTLMKYANLVTKFNYKDQIISLAYLKDLLVYFDTT